MRAWLVVVLVAAAAAHAQDSPPPRPQSTAPASSSSAGQPSSQSSTPDQTAPTIASGTVRTADGSPIPGASLRLINTDTRKAFISWTDESGKFQFAALPAGHYTVEASQLGFLPSRLDMQLGGGPPPPSLQLTLRVASLAELENPSGTQRPGGRRFGQGQGPGGQAANGAGNAGNRQSAGNGGYGNGRGGRGQQLPPGLLNAMSQGMGGFQQTDLTGEAAQGEEAIGGVGGSGAEANLAATAAAGSADSFVLQGTVGQGLSQGGFAGPGASAVLALAQNMAGVPGQPGPGPSNGNPFAGATAPGAAGGGFGLGGLFGGGGGFA
ncbi:MAG: carboxypeptidase-like regulatory domain-containing protein, partial [Candidatus Acidiferrales bacterium]